MDIEIMCLQKQLHEILQSNFALGQNIEETQFKILLNNDIIEKNKNMILQLSTLELEFDIIKNKF